jgi:NitT/TauT family transport system permease protein
MNNRSCAAQSRFRVERAISIVSPVALLLLWEIASRTNAVDARILPPPTRVAASIWSMVISGDLVRDSAITTARFLAGMIVGTVPGVLIGLTMGLFGAVRAALNPIVAAFSNAPRIALFPLILILFGLHERSNVLMIALGPFFTMLITAMGAVMNVDPIYRDVARNFHARPHDLYFRITLPAIAPALMDGLRISVGLGLLGTVAVEFLVGESGLGHLIWSSWQILSLTQSMAGLVAASIIGWIFYSSLSALQRRVIPWQKALTF